ncbi:aminotransferase class V-fold PLP-dependent enzyme [Vulgatibacter incomptus]|uniref:Cysteine desulfurase n=1 Tax=Vulgatibacter incomptus TaxID=1391653 RepID=A0A0K1PDN9_9BACT|nr:aminotransferase class V-fold PLP-dependent enzyme [Vulgatibacter incomptus]AKU91622.1 Cysteine desulfurase [Vulgatibacter incomptus]
MRPLGELRAEFPLLETCTYLNSNSTGAIPRGAEAVLQRYWKTLASWRDEAWAEWIPAVGAYADGLAALVGGRPGTVITDSNLSVLLGRLATCFEYGAPRNRVVITDLEFPTVPFIWKGFERYGAETVIVRSENGRIDEERLCAAIDERTLLVCVSHASFATGALLDLRPVAERCRATGALLAVDAYQSVGIVPIDVQELGVDFLLAGAHKWLCGGIESAFLYVRPELLPSLSPAATGWMAGANPLSFGPTEDYAPGIGRFASGTPAVLPALLSRPGLDLLAGVGVDAIRAHSLRCTTRIMERADEAGFQVLTPRPPEQRGGVVALRFAGDAAVTRRLVERGFVCSYRGALRVAPHFYNSLEEVERFMDELTREAHDV